MCMLEGAAIGHAVGKRRRTRRYVAEDVDRDAAVSTGDGIGAYDLAAERDEVLLGLLELRAGKA